jgi:hypothetical protein
VVEKDDWRCTHGSRRLHVTLIISLWLRKFAAEVRVATIDSDVDRGQELENDENEGCWGVGLNFAVVIFFFADGT